MSQFDLFLYVTHAYIKIKNNFELKFVDIFLFSSLNICFGFSKEPSH